MSERLKSITDGIALEPNAASFAALKSVKMRLETIAVHAGAEIDSSTGALAPPLHLSTTFEHGRPARPFKDSSTCARKILRISLSNTRSALRRLWDSGTRRRFREKVVYLPLGGWSNETLRCLANPIEWRPLYPSTAASGRFEREDTNATSRSARGRNFIVECVRCSGTGEK